MAPMVGGSANASAPTASEDPSGAASIAGVASFNGRTGAVLGVDSFNGSTGVVTYQPTLVQATVAQLASAPAALYQEGQFAYVQSVKAFFVLVTSAQATSAYVRLAASGRPTFLWMRVLESETWWSQATWYVDPANASGVADDENTGANAAGAGVGPLRTFAELGRRFRGRNMPGTEAASYVVNLLSDTPDTDFPQMHIGSNARAGIINISITGVTTSIVAVGAITSAVARNAATNTANSITFTGFDFSPYVGKLVRLVATPTTTAVIEAAPSLGVAQLSQRDVNGTPGGDFTGGDNVEIPIFTKLPGYTQEGPGTQVFFTSLTLNPASNIKVTAPGANVVLIRCDVRGGSTGLWTCGVLNFNACGINKTQGPDAGVVVNTTGGALTTGAILALPASGTRHHLASFGMNNGQLVLSDGAIVRFNGDFHCFNLATGLSGIVMGPGTTAYFAAAYYGSGNNANSAGLALAFNAKVFYSATPVMDAAKGCYFDGAQGGGISAGTALPFAGGVGVGLPLTPGTITAGGLSTAVQSAKLNAMMGI